MSRHVACFEVLAETLRRTSRLAAHARDVACDHQRVSSPFARCGLEHREELELCCRQISLRRVRGSEPAPKALCDEQVAGGLDLREVVVDELDDLGVSPLIHEAERNRSEREPHGQLLTSAQREVARAQKLVERPRPLEVPRGTDAIGAHHGREPRGAARDEALVRVVHVVEAAPVAEKEALHSAKAEQACRALDTELVRECEGPLGNDRRLVVSLANRQHAGELGQGVEQWRRWA